MKIAVLGWGSLLWDHSSDYDTLHGSWNSDGPILPLEYSRISRSRLGALTLVIDMEHGVENIVKWCLSIKDTLTAAIYDLQVREKTTDLNIGKFEINSQDFLSGLNSILCKISKWVQGHDLDAAIWTALPSNFHEKQNEEYTVDNAIQYIRKLPSKSRAKAIEYISKTPASIVTPFRMKIKNQEWFK